MQQRSSNISIPYGLKLRRSLSNRALENHTCSWKPGFNLFYGVEKRDGEPHAPSGSIRRCLRVIPRANLDADRLLPDLDDLTEQEIDRNGPLMRNPVVCSLRIEHD